MSQPTTPRRLAGAVTGSLVAGLAISALLLRGEAKTGKPSELADLERAGLAQLGRDTPPPAALPDRGEQALIQGGHLLLSAAAGAVFAMTTDDDAEVLPSGIAFGMAFYGAMHWVLGPALALKPPEWQSDRETITMHTLNHVGFGIVTAVGAALASRA